MNEWELLVRKAIQTPPRHLARRVSRFVARQVTQRRERHRRIRFPTYSTAPDALKSGGFQKSQTLARFFSAPVLEYMPSPAVAASQWVGDRYLEHRFDLLGSGWTQWRFGAPCRGLHGFSYPVDDGSPADDASGSWLAGRINQANLECSQNLWRMIEQPYEAIDWHRDMKSGYQWDAKTWCHDIVYGSVPGADVKVPWELSRLQHLPQLAIAYGLAKDGADGFHLPSTYAREFRNQSLDFLATNPPWFGVNWACAMDAGIRIANLLTALDLFRAFGETFDDRFLTVVHDAARDHGRFLIRNLEWSPELRSNHYLGDIAGLLFAAAFLPSRDETDAWLHFAADQLLVETEYQFNEDGSNFEASTNYHRLSSELVLYATAVLLATDAKRLQSPPSQAHLPAKPTVTAMQVWKSKGVLETRIEHHLQRIAAMRRFTIDVTRPDGDVAQIGDNDSGRFLKLEPAFQRSTVGAIKARFANLQGYAELGDDSDYWFEDPLDHRHLVATIEGLLGRPPAGRAPSSMEAKLVSDLTALPDSYAAVLDAVKEPHMALTAAEAELPFRVRRQIRLEPAAGHSLKQGLRLRAYPDFGVYILRSERLFLSLRCGPVGQSGNGGHAHVDQLSVEVAIDGEPWVRDPGTYLYTPVPLVRNRYRSSGVHSSPIGDAGDPDGMTEYLFRLPPTIEAEMLRIEGDELIGAVPRIQPVIWRRVRVLDRAVLIEDASAPGASSIEHTRLHITSPEAARELFDVVPFSMGYGTIELRPSETSNEIGR